MFAGTADYYDQFRPDLPIEVRDFILKQVALPLTLLDLGAGTGRITEQFAPFFSDIIAVEPEAAMAELAGKRLAHKARVLQTTAEEMELPDAWRASLVTIFRAFHWMDREVVLRKLDTVVAHDGLVAVGSDRSFWHIDDDWGQAIQSVIRHVLGDERKTLHGPYQRPPRAFSQDFAASPFSVVNKYDFPVVRTWNADQIIGYLYSSSFASKELLGSRVNHFERDIRRELLAFSPNDTFVEHNEFELFLARRP